MNERNYRENEEGLRKIRTLIDEQKTVMIASQLDKTPFSVCPMILQQMDDKGDLWFFTSKDSALYKDIEKDNRVQIIYSDERKQKYLSMFGNATHIIDREKREELWNHTMLKWFTGKEDPDLALLSVNLQNSYFWDSENNKPVPFFPMDQLSKEREKEGEKGYVNL